MYVCIYIYLLMRVAPTAAVGGVGLGVLSTSFLKRFRTGEKTGEKMLRARSDSDCEAFYRAFIWCVCVCV
jgi:hypothetical protein